MSSAEATTARSSYEAVAQLIAELWERELADFRQREAEIEERVEAAEAEICRLRGEASGVDREAAQLRAELDALPEQLMRANLREDPDEERRVRRRYSQLEGAIAGCEATAVASREELRRSFDPDPDAAVQRIKAEGYPLIDERTELWRRIGEEHDRLVRLLGQRYSELRGKPQAPERSARERKAYLAALRRG